MLTAQLIRKAGAASSRLSASKSKSERAIINAFNHIRTTLSTAGIHQQMQFGNYEGAIDAIVLPFHALGDSLVQIYLNAAQEFTDNIGQQIGQHVSFNPAQPRVVSEMRNLRAFFIQDLNATMRSAVRDVVLHGLTYDWTIDQMVVAMMNTPGLTSRDLVAIENYRQGIERGDMRRLLQTDVRDRRYDAAVMNGTAADRHLVRMVAAKERLTRQISLNRLVQTETLRAQSMGRNALLEQLVDLGTIEAENVQRTWRSALLPRTRDSHAAQHGETRNLNEAFSNGLMYPGDPNGPASEVINCQCDLTIDVQPTHRNG